MTTTNTFDGNVDRGNNGRTLSLSCESSPFQQKPLCERKTKIKRSYGKMAKKVKNILPRFKTTSVEKKKQVDDSYDDENTHPNTNTKVFEEKFKFPSPNPSCSNSNKKGFYLSPRNSNETKMYSKTSKPNRSIFSPPTGTGNRNACFSTLAKSGDIDSAWINQVEHYESGDIFQKQGTGGNLTPKLKLTSKKRGVCASPIVEDIDESLISWSQNNIPSTKSYRRKSRSRLFSPTTVEKLDAKKAGKLTIDRSNSAINFSEYRKNESDDEKYARRSSGIMDDHSNSEDDDQHHTVMLPPKPKRKSSPQVVKSVFGGRHPCWKDDDGKDISYVSEKSLSPLPVSICNSSKQHNNSMVLPSYEDQKYLLKILLKHKRGRGKQAFVGSTSCTVALPCAWSAERKATFLQWSKSVGFTVRAAGGNDTFLQTSLEKSTEILKYLQENLHVTKKRCSQKQNQIYLSTENNPAHFGQNDNHNSTLMSYSIEENLPFSYIEIPSGKMNVGRAMDQNDSTIDIDLLKNLHDLKLDNGNNESSFFGESKIKKPEINLCISPPFSYSRRTDEHITPKDASYEEHSFLRPPRLSGEPLKRNELMMHLYGTISPATTESTYINPTKTLLLDSNEKSSACSRAELSFEMLESKITTANDVSFSSASIGKVGVYKNIDLTPCVTKPTIHNQHCSHETPMMKDASTGKDWGVSEGCASSIIAVLFQRLEDACSDATEQAATETEPDEIVLASCSALGFEEISHDKMERNQQSRITGNNSNNMKKCVKFYTQDENNESPLNRKKEKIKLSKVQKHRRVSLCVSSLKDNITTINNKHMFAMNETTTDYTRNQNVMTEVFSFLSARDLNCVVSLVCHSWANISSVVLASSMLSSMDFPTDLLIPTSEQRDSFGTGVQDDGMDVVDFISPKLPNHSVTNNMERTWQYLVREFPRGMYLSEGAYKKVHKVWNRSVEAEEAISVMDVDQIDSSGQKEVIAAEMAVSMLLSSLVRRNICPNFVATRDVFLCPYEPPSTLWGCEKWQKPFGDHLKDTLVRKRAPREPGKNSRGRYLYTRMELCIGDIEGYIAKQPSQVIRRTEARNLLFQMSFSLHVAQNYLGLKHYDVKLLNFLLQPVDNRETSMIEDGDNESTTVMRYGVGDHVFQLRASASRALVAKLADYGTAKIRSYSNGQPVTIGQFATIENTPPEYFTQGDAAKQGHGHDCFGLGLCMLHLFTGHGPYEEILENILCPKSLEQKLQQIWESKSPIGFEVIKSVILADTYEDEDGNIDGVTDEIPYHTFYRYLVLFGIPKDIKNELKKKPGTPSARVWRAVTSLLEGKGADSFKKEQKEFNILTGTDFRIARARHELEALGGMKLLLSLVSFDPLQRATPLDVINSSFMEPLREQNDGMALDNCNVHSFMKFATRHDFR